MTCEIDETIMRLIWKSMMFSSKYLIMFQQKQEVTLGHLCQWSYWIAS